MTSPLGQPTFRTAPETNETIRSFHRKVEAALDRRVIINDLLAACMSVAIKHEGEVLKLIRAGQ